MMHLIHYIYKHILKNNDRCRISRSDYSLLLSSERLVSVSQQTAQAYCLPKANNSFASARNILCCNLNMSRSLEFVQFHGLINNIVFQFSSPKSHPNSHLKLLLVLFNVIHLLKSAYPP